MHTERMDVVDIQRGGARGNGTGHWRVDRVDAAFVQRHPVTWRIMHEICRAAHRRHTSPSFTSLYLTYVFPLLSQLSRIPPRRIHLDEFSINETKT
jgi:hypothetical protein